MCLTGIRERRALQHRGFELANGLPFVATDVAMHELLAAHTVAEAKDLQLALGKLRRVSGHFGGRVLVVDPHRIKSYSKRRMRRHIHERHSRATNVAQTFFCLDGDTQQPLGFVTGTASRTVTTATPELLELAAGICGPEAESKLVLADARFQRQRVTRTRKAAAAGSVGVDLGGDTGTTFIEFFFAGRIRR